MIQSFAAVIPPEAVDARHYFLESLQRETVVWGIRGSCLLAAAATLVIYWKLKKGNGE